MAGKVGDYYSEQALKHAARIITWVPSSTLALHLFTGVVSAAGAGPEVSGNGYAPSSIANDATKFGFSALRLTTVSDLNSATPTGTAWGTIVAVSFTEPADLTKVYYYGTLTQPIISVVGQQLVIPAGAFTADILSA